MRNFAYDENEESSNDSTENNVEENENYMEDASVFVDPSQRYMEIRMARDHPERIMMDADDGMLPMGFAQPSGELRKVPFERPLIPELDDLGFYHTFGQRQVRDAEDEINDTEVKMYDDVYGPDTSFHDFNMRPDTRPIVFMPEGRLS